jgi:GntR family transcriptional regulator, transcriptional repressor for pyruvate dehydrogenase complex
MAKLFSPVNGGRISVQIVDQIQTAIRQGELTPGDRLPPERELAELFGVSRVTVRDALRTLEVLGLVEIRVGAAGGAFVRTPDGGLLGEGMENLLAMSTITPEEIAEARLVLELGTVALATARASDEDIAELREVCAQSRAALEAGNYQREHAMEFHVRLAKTARNSAVNMLADSIRGPLSLNAVRRREPQEASHRATVEEHEQIIEAIAAGDITKAQRVMAEHLLRGTLLPEDALRALLGERSGLVGQ